eukprot:Blabericola_migrator_1__11628@NODE_69_length_15356_cov_75_151481_g62_i0_p3_GENE_NODE_69_length_15356_cov_75_151481_g62_i0NODE_69_length_15356_cov_75_151481_g62_i0_p3_ORF_typecomplete_len730_score98_96_NODE_69_length_15356_cov_75_151481_g62_i063218510
MRPPCWAALYAACLICSVAGERPSFASRATANGDANSITRSMLPSYTFGGSQVGRFSDLNKDELQRQLRDLAVFGDSLKKQVFEKFETYRKERDFSETSPVDPSFRPPRQLRAADPAPVIESLVNYVVQALMTWMNTATMSVNLPISATQASFGTTHDVVQAFDQIIPPVGMATLQAPIDTTSVMLDVMAGAINTVERSIDQWINQLAVTTLESMGINPGAQHSAFYPDNIGVASAPCDQTAYQPAGLAGLPGADLQMAEAEPAAGPVFLPVDVGPPPQTPQTEGAGEGTPSAQTAQSASAPSPAAQAAGFQPPQAAPASTPWQAPQSFQAAPAAPSYSGPQPYPGAPAASAHPGPQPYPAYPGPRPYPGPPAASGFPAGQAPQTAPAASVPPLPPPLSQSLVNTVLNSYVHLEAAMADAVTNVLADFVDIMTGIVENTGMLMGGVTDTLVLPFGGILAPMPAAYGAPDSGFAPLGAPAFSPGFGPTTQSVASTYPTANGGAPYSGGGAPQTTASANDRYSGFSPATRSGLPTADTWTPWLLPTNTAAPNPILQALGLQAATPGEVAPSVAASLGLTTRVTDLLGVTPEGLTPLAENIGAADPGTITVGDVLWAKLNGKEPIRVQYPLSFLSVAKPFIPPALYEPLGIDAKFQTTTTTTPATTAKLIVSGITKITPPPTPAPPPPPPPEPTVVMAEAPEPNPLPAIDRGPSDAMSVVQQTTYISSPSAE